MGYKVRSVSCSLWHENEQLSVLQDDDIPATAIAVWRVDQGRIHVTVYCKDYRARAEFNAQMDRVCELEMLLHNKGKMRNNGTVALNYITGFIEQCITELELQVADEDKAYAAAYCDRSVEVGGMRMTFVEDYGTYGKH